MFKIHRWVRDFFGLSRSETNGFLILLPVMAVIMFSAPVWRWLHARDPIDFGEDQLRLDSMVALWEQGRSTDVVQQKGEGAIRLVKFDPNQATVSELESLGFSTQLARRMASYRQKGGQFRVRSDLLKIYDMDSSLYRRLYSYIDLPDRLAVIPNTGKESGSRKEVQRRADLNLADTAELKTVYGIGERLSVRIVRFREALGGFVRAEQLREVYGLDSTVVDRALAVFYVDGKFVPRRLNINTASDSALAAHPYLAWSEARAIVTYRFQHGEFAGLEDLRKIRALNEETIGKIAPYLSIHD